MATTFTLYVHLIPQTTSLISETVRLTFSDTSIINDLRLLIAQQLAKQNDGNKIYQIKAITASSHPESQVLALNRLVSSYFENLQDVYCHVEVGVDPKKHVKPIEVKPAPTANK
jgi:hypothetical protein